MQIHVFGVEQDGDHYRVMFRETTDDGKGILFADQQITSSRNQLTEELRVLNIQSDKAERLKGKTFSADQIESWKQENWDIQKFLNDMAEAE